MRTVGLFQSILFGFISYLLVRTLLNYADYQSKMHLQVFPNDWSNAIALMQVIVWMVLMALLLYSLISERLVMMSLLLPLLLWLIYLIYSLLAASGGFNPAPCACVSYFRNLDWVDSSWISAGLVVFVSCFIVSQFLKQKEVNVQDSEKGWCT